jgi:hypothetical protein
MMPPSDIIHPWEAHLDGIHAISHARNDQTIGTLRDSEGLTAITDDTQSANGSRSPVDELNRHLGEPTPYGHLQAAAAALHRLIRSIRPIFQSASNLLAIANHSIREEVENLQATLLSHLSRFNTWAVPLRDDWRPKPLQYAQSGLQAFPSDIYPGRIDIYPDCQWPSDHGMNLAD